MLSLTAASGRPTSTVFGSAPAETSTSTSTGSASIPNNENVCSLASMIIACTSNDGRPADYLHCRRTKQDSVQLDNAERKGSTLMRKLLGLIIGLSAASHMLAATDVHPNIIFILAD